MVAVPAAPDTDPAPARRVSPELAFARIVSAIIQQELQSGHYLRRADGMIVLNPERSIAAPK